MRRNIGSALPLRWHVAPMRAYDELPAPLRRWLAQAALPWSVPSALRIWSMELRRGGTADSALARLARAEAKMLARERLIHAGLDQNGRGRGRVARNAMQ